MRRSTDTSERRTAWRARLRGVRARSSLAATLIVAAALASGSGALVFLLHQSLTASVDSSIDDRIEEISAELDAVKAGTSSAELLTSLAPVVRLASRQGTVIQILAADGSVLAQSPQIEGEAALGLPLAAGDGAIREETTLPVEEEDLYRVVREAVESPAGTLTIVAAQSLEAVGESTSAVLSLLTIGFPLLLIVVGASAYWLVGRSLEPVEAIRAKVAAIGARQLGDRVPVPPAGDEIARLAVTMNEMLDRLQAAQISQRRFVADASHELRSPIATIRAMAETAAAHPQDVTASSITDGIIAEASRLERLVGDLLLLARADERGLTVEHRDVDLDDLLASERDRVRSTTDLTVISHIEAVQVSGSPHQLARALRNLVDNAARHARDTIALTLRREGPHMVVLEVQDDGDGIPVQDRQRVFDRFVRLDESRVRTQGGTGLGLAIVKEIVDAHGGDVRVVDSPSGATLRVVLPAK